jgi:triacylglycerol lipase
MITQLKPKIIRDDGEVPFVLYSDVDRPLSEMTFLRRALVLAELAVIAYNDEAEAKRAAEAIGFRDAQLFDKNGAQAYRFRNEHDVIFACRGTEPNEWNDIHADANASMVLVSTFGRVHSGFNHEVDDLWPLMEKLLEDNSLKAWFCGHSLGAAMATICAYRCQVSPIWTNPQELHTFGSPRVGCKKYINHAKITHYRWVQNNDVVTRVPPAWFGYRHGGEEIYIDRNGRIKRLTGLWRSRDRWRGLLKGLTKWKVDLLTDHSMRLYAENIALAVDKEMETMAAGGKATAQNDIVIRARD